MLDHMLGHMPLQKVLGKHKHLKKGVSLGQIIFHMFIAI